MYTSYTNFVCAWYVCIMLHLLTSVSSVVYDSEEEVVGCSDACINAGHCQCSKCRYLKKNLIQRMAHLCDLNFPWIAAAAQSEWRGAFSVPWPSWWVGTKCWPPFLGWEGETTSQFIVHITFLLRPSSTSQVGKSRHGQQVWWGLEACGPLQNPHLHSVQHQTPHGGPSEAWRPW